MRAAFAYLCVALVLLQSFSRELLLAGFAFNRASLTARYCVNRARPRLRCQGRCYFAKQLKKQQERENKSPNPLRERLDLLPLAASPLVPARPAAYAAGPGRYAALPTPEVQRLGWRGVFHPPRA